MDGIRIVIFLVRCSVDLLFCDTVSTDHLRYVYTVTCRGEASRLIATMQIRAASEVWMAKCRYQLISAGAAEPWRAPSGQSPSAALSRRNSRGTGPTSGPTPQSRRAC